jgi:hypothetical protein
MKTDTFVKLVVPEILRSPDVTDTSFLRSNIRAIGRKFESGDIDGQGVMAEIERLLPWQLGRDIKKSIEKILR